MANPRLLALLLAGTASAQQPNFLPRTCGGTPHVAAFEATVQTSIASPGYGAYQTMNDGHTVFGYCDGTYTGNGGCPRGTRAFTVVEFDLSELDENAEVCMASISMQQTDRGVNVENVVAYPITMPDNAAITDGETWGTIFPHIDTTTETIHAATCEHGEGSCNGGGSCHINDEGHCVGVRGDGLHGQPCTFVPGLAFNGQGRHEFAGGQDFEELIQDVLHDAGRHTLRIAIGATEGNEMDSLCKPSSTYEEANHHHEVNGFQCSQGVTLHMTYHSSGVTCDAAGWNKVYDGCEMVQDTCGGKVGLGNDMPCMCDEVCAEKLDAFNKKCIGTIPGVTVGPVQRVQLHRKHAQQCAAITGGLEEKNTLVVIQFAGTTQTGVDPNGFFTTDDGDIETVCLTASELSDNLSPPGLGVEMRSCDTNSDGAVEERDTPDLAKWILRPDGKIQNAATMLCLRRASCAHGQAPNMGPPGVWDLHDCADASVFLTWSDPRGAHPDACPNGWLGPNSDEPCIASGTCDSCPAAHQTVEGYPKPGGPFHMEEVVGASLQEMIRGSKHCGDHTTHCYAPQPITADLIGRGGGLCGTHLKQTNNGRTSQDMDAWWIFEQISGPGMDEAQAILSLKLNSQHRALMTAADSGQQRCEANDPDDPTKDCPTLRNALAVALTVPPRDIRLRAVDTAGGVVDFQVVGGRAARHAVEEAVDVTHTNNENYGILASMGTIDGLTFADNPVMTENLVLATCGGGAPPGDGPILGPEVVDRTGCPEGEDCRKLWTSGFLPASLHCLQETKGHTYVDEGKQTYIVPDNVQAVNIWMSAGGGGLGSQAHPRSTGGAAGFSWATFRVQPEWRNSDGKIELKVYVGCAGESAGVGVQGVGGGGGGGSAVLDLQGNVLVVAGGAGGQAGAWDASRQADGEMSSTHGGHGGGPQGGDGGTTPCNGGAAGGGGGGQSLAGTAGGSNRGYDPGMPGHGRNGGDGGGFTASCHPVDESTNSPMAWTDDAYEEACDDLLGCTYLPPSKEARPFCPVGEACCGVQTIGGMHSMGNITTYGGSGFGIGGMGHTVPCDGGGGGGGGGWRGGGGGGGSCHGTGGGGGSGYINTGHKGYEAGGSIAGRGSMEAVDGWIWIVPVVCPVAADDNSGWSWWQYVLLLVLIGIALYFCNMNKDYIGELCGVSLAKMQPGGGRNSHALGIDLEVSFNSAGAGDEFSVPPVVT